jgi:hypothetical protein
VSNEKHKAGDVLLTEYGDTVEMLVFVSSNEAMRSEFPTEYAANIEKALAEHRQAKESK